MPDPAEVDLIRRCQEGREDAFRELVERYQKRTFWIARNMLNNPELARDISQEAFVRVFRNIRRFDVTKNFYTWLYQIVVNLSIDHLRRRSHTRFVGLEQVGAVAEPLRRGPSAKMEEADLRRQVRESLDRLPAKYKAVLSLRDISGFSCGEIAEIVGCSNPTVRWRLHRARRLFKIAWESRHESLVESDES